MSFKAKKNYLFSKEDEKKVFNLILKQTLNKEIEWSVGNPILTGLVGEDKILLYRGETRTAVSIQNKKEYAFFEITKEQEEFLKNLISGKSLLDLTSTEFAENIWSGKKFAELSQANLEPKAKKSKPKEKTVKAISD